MFFLLLLALAAAPAPAAQVARKIVSDNGDPILYPSYLTVYDGSLFFRANNLTNGNNVELWAFNGDVARMVADINPGSAGSDPSYLAAYNGTLYSEDTLKSTLEASVNARTVWVKVQPLDTKVSQVWIQVRTKGGGTDMELAGEIDKQIAIRLAAGNLTPAQSQPKPR